jgi:hypothetical protein
MKELVADGEEITVTDESLPISLSIIVSIKK